MKNIGLLFSVLALCGCTLSGSTPTKVVDEVFMKYQKVDDEISLQLDEIMLLDDTLDTDQKATYKTIMKNQFRNMSYDIKESVIDGDDATVKVEIEVYDFDNSLDNSEIYLNTNPTDLYNEEGAIDSSKFIDYKLDQMDEEKERIKYTLELTLTKLDSEWVLDDFTQSQKEKIHGVYNYD